MSRSKWSGEVELQSIMERRCIQSVCAAGRAVLIVVLLSQRGACCIRVASTHQVRVCLTTTTLHP
jgi:hypothetical protein